MAGGSLVFVIVKGATLWLLMSALPLYGYLQVEFSECLSRPPLGKQLSLWLHLLPKATIAKYLTGCLNSSVFQRSEQLEIQDKVSAGVVPLEMFLLGLQMVIFS